MASAYRAIREADWAELRARYEAGASTADLAAELDLARKTVQNQLRSHGTRMRTGTIPARLPVSDTDLLPPTPLVQP